MCTCNGPLDECCCCSVGGVGYTNWEQLGSRQAEQQRTHIHAICRRLLMSSRATVHMCSALLRRNRQSMYDTSISMQPQQKPFTRGPRPLHKRYRSATREKSPRHTYLNVAGFERRCCARRPELILLPSAYQCRPRGERKCDLHAEEVRLRRRSSGSVVR